MTASQELKRQVRATVRPFNVSIQWYFDRSKLAAAAGFVEQWSPWENGCRHLVNCQEQAVVTGPLIERAYRLGCRWQRFLHYMREVAPRWREIDRIHYADNSIEAVQVSRSGERRQVMVVAPGGDACY